VAGRHFVAGVSMALPLMRTSAFFNFLEWSKGIFRCHLQWFPVSWKWPVLFVVQSSSSDFLPLRPSTFNICFVLSVTCPPLPFPYYLVASCVTFPYMLLHIFPIAPVKEGTFTVSRPVIFLSGHHMAPATNFSLSSTEIIFRQSRFFF
jgi:hypothetical protein